MFHVEHLMEPEIRNSFGMLGEENKYQSEDLQVSFLKEKEGRWALKSQGRFFGKNEHFF